MTQITLRHGIFLPPFHPMEENPTACLDRDLDLMVWLDRLGFHEAWIGEHHSAGFEIISSPEIFIAIAAERTKFIRFGTGVTSLPYHNPLMWRTALCSSTTTRADASCSARGRGFSPPTR
jgi:limonene 1,2-monooxygenase